MKPHRQQLTRLPHPWDSPGKNTGVGCHFLLQCMKVKIENEVAQSCLTLRNPMDCSLPGSSVHGIFQARVLEWVVISFSKLFTTKLLLFARPLLGLNLPTYHSKLSVPLGKASELSVFTACLSSERNLGFTALELVVHFSWCITPLSEGHSGFLILLLSV